MATAKIITVEKNEGGKIPYEVSGTKIIFGEDELMVNLKTRQRDYETTLDICKDKERLDGWGQYVLYGICGTGHNTRP